MADGPEARHRAKVYCLNEDGQWDDRGTGHAAVQYLPAEEAAFIVVLSEDDCASHLLQARVLMDDIYQRQQGAPHQLLLPACPATGSSLSLSLGLSLRPSPGPASPSPPG